MSLKNISNAFVLASVCLLYNQAPAEAATKSYHFGAWVVKVDHDNFANVNYCKMVGRDMTYGDGIVSLNFKPDVDTEEAWYRINGGELAQVKTFRVQVDKLSVFREPGPLENPSAGKARFPADVLSEASYVDIRPNEKAKIKHFKVDGLSAALAFMTERACVTPNS